MGMKRCGCESYEIITTDSCTKEGPFFRHRRRHKKIKRAVFHTSSLCSLKTVPSPPPQQVLHTVRYSFFLFHFPVSSLFLNTLRTGDADLRLYITTVQDG